MAVRYVSAVHSPLAARSRLILASLLVGCAAAAVGCGGTAEDYSGFESAEECLRAMPLVRPDIEADALGERCSVSIAMAEIALDAASLHGLSSVESADDGNTEEGASEGDGIVQNGERQDSTNDAGSEPGGSAGSGSAMTSTTALSAGTTEAELPSGTAPSDSDVAGGIEVPDVQGLDHQLAQDTMQFAGLRNLAEEDASGEGRRLIWDRNWIVVDQDPAPGTVVDPDTKITLYSLKDDEVGN